MKWKTGIRLFKETIGGEIKKGEENIAKEFYYQCEKCRRTFTGWRLKTTCNICEGELKEISEVKFNEVVKGNK